MDATFHLHSPSQFAKSVHVDLSPHGLSPDQGNRSQELCFFLNWQRRAHLLNNRLRPQTGVDWGRGGGVVQLINKSETKPLLRIIALRFPRTLYLPLYT